MTRPGERGDAGDAGGPAPDAFTARVHDALSHLHDVVYLQTHPLANQTTADPRTGVPARGRALQRALIEAVEALRPRAGADQANAGRSHRVLALRYLDGLGIPAVQDHLAISRSGYFRAHRRGLAAVAAILRPAWGAPGAATADGGTRAGRPPSPVSSFVGREREIGVVGRLLARSRLVTLTGAPGVGKTRLALEVAARVGDRLADRVCLVPLAPIADPEGVVPAIARSLDVRDDGTLPPLDRLIARLADASVLLLLDNFEHVAAAAPRVSALLEGCPRVRALVTSRAALRVRGEHEVVVPPLALPIEGRIAEAESVRLLVERAQAVRADFALTAENAPAVAAICRRLDGLPLAIELAAARLRLWSPHELLVQLDRRLALLTDGAVDLPARQRTLRAAIAWSHDLLGPTERALFRRLAVFAGGAPFGAIAAVYPAASLGSTTEPAGAEGTLDDLAALVEGSLLERQDDPGGEPRFAMLETIREYAQERLAAEDDAPAARRRHAEYFLALVQEAARHKMTAGQADWLDRLEREHANLRDALAWWVGEQDASAALRFGAAAWDFWALRGHVREGRRELARLLVLPGADAPMAARATCLNGAGRLALNQGDVDEARRYYEEALAVAGRVADDKATFVALQGLGRLAMERGDLAVARARFEEVRTLARRSGLAGMGVPERMLGLIALEEGDHAAARAYFEQELADARERAHHHGIALGLTNLGRVAHAGGDPARARALYQEALPLLRRFGDKRVIAQVLTNLGMAATDLADRAAARACLTEALATARELDDRAMVALALEGFAGLAATGASPARATLLDRAARVLRQRNGAGRPRSVGHWLAGRLPLAPTDPRGETGLPVDTAEATALEDAVALALSDGTC